MRPFWHPLSAILLDDPPVFATPGLLLLLARRGRRVEATYAGDRMWPAIAHASRIAVDPGGARVAAPGDVMLAWPGGIPDVLRVAAVRGRRLVLTGDAAPGEHSEVAADEVLGRVATESVHVPRAVAASRRLVLDATEALRAGVDVPGDPAETVREKYQEQAPFYARLQAPAWDPGLSARVRSAVRPGGSVLVAGSGAGHEAFALAREGYRVRGLDYAPGMVDASRRAAAELGLDVTFELGDLRTHEEPDGGLDAVFFTYDVYSFVPGSADRVGMLGRMARWLAPGGSVFLGVRRVRTPYQRVILSLQSSRDAGPRAPEWGSSHTRRISPGGELRRSFVRYFTRSALLREVASAGFEAREWVGGHVRVVRRPNGGSGAGAGA